jgi:hypothetical protein
MKFKEWLIINEKFTEAPPLGDPARRPDLIKGGLGGCPELPMGVRSMCQPTTSAFQTGTIKKRSKR